GHGPGVELGARGEQLLAALAGRPAQGPALQLVALAADRHPVVDAAERSLHEAELVDLGVGGERPDQADVRTLGGLDRADPAVVAVVDVADVEPGPLAAQAAR